jgi:uncharacterized membrane protein
MPYTTITLNHGVAFRHTHNYNHIFKTVLLAMAPKVAGSKPTEEDEFLWVIKNP